MNIEEFRLEVLKKIDPQIKSTAETRITKDYLNSFVGALNRGLQDLSTTGKYLLKEYRITQQEMKSLLPMDLLNLIPHYQEPIRYEAKATSYYFEVDGPAEVLFTIEGTEIQRINHLTRGFTAYKGFLSNPDLKPVQMCFTGRYAYNLRNIAMYDQPFAEEADIWEFVPERRYDLRVLVNDFYQLHEVVFQSGLSDVRYEKTDDFYFEGDSVLVLNGLRKGEWVVHYYAYPRYIPEGVPKEYELELDPEVLQLLLIYVASELIWDDDRATSGAWRNHYEAGKELLRPVTDLSKKLFKDVQGW